MKASEILELLRAGYTRAEIDAMNAEPAPEATPEPEAEPEATEEVAPDAPTPEPDEPTINNADLIKAIETLTKTVQASNKLFALMPDASEQADALQTMLDNYVK